MIWTLIRGGFTLAVNIGATMAVIDYLHKKDPQKVRSAQRGAEELARNITELFQVKLKNLNEQFDGEDRCSEYDEHKNKK